MSFAANRVALRIQLRLKNVGKVGLKFWDKMGYPQCHTHILAEIALGWDAPN